GEGNGDVVRELRREAANVREDGDFGLVDHQLWEDVLGEDAGDRPGRGVSFIGTANILPHPVVDVQANQLVVQVCIDGAIHDVADRAIWLAPDFALPGQVDLGASVGHREAH